MVITTKNLPLNGKAGTNGVSYGNTRTLVLKKDIVKLGLWLAALFVILFLFRLLYSWFSPYIISDLKNREDFFSQVENLPKNYASDNSIAANNEQNATPFVKEQKYEKVAFIKTVSSQFENDYTAIKRKIHEFDGVIQFEKKSGIGNSRRSHFLIAVSPLEFEPFYTAVQSIGVVTEKDMTTLDKTLEYQRLCARKTSFEKTLASLKEFKHIEENSNFNLKDKILETETLLQEVEIDLSYFTADRAFCTVKLSLYESAAEKKIAFLPVVKISFGWAIKYYPLCLSALVFILLFKNLDKIKLPEITFGKLKS